AIIAETVAARLIPDAPMPRLAFGVSTSQYSPEFPMPRYAITEKAGRFVAAHRNTGVGMVLEPTEKQAEHELRLGSLVALDISLGPSQPTQTKPVETASPTADATVEATRKIRRGKQ